MKQKEFKQFKPFKVEKKDNKMRASTTRAIKRIVAIALLVLGIYYLLVAGKIIAAQVVFGTYLPSTNALALIGVVVIIFALFLDDNWRAKVKNAFS